MQKVSGSLVMWTLASLLIAAQVRAQAPLTQRPGVAIPPQPLAGALQLWASQTGWQLMYDSTLAANQQSSGAPEGLNPIEGLARILNGTGLAYRFLNERTITILSSSYGSTATRIYPASMRLAVDSTSPRNVRGAQATSPSPDGTQNKQDSVSSIGDDSKLEVVVTGTRFSDRTVLTSPVPVDIVSADSLRSGGYSELTQSLAAEVPALNFGPVLTASQGSALRSFSYRGLPAAQVLVLVNGKRWHPSANGGTVSFDFNSIAPTAISSVEILRDGASAQYGSDAIAGVVNLLLRKDTQTELSLTGGQYYEGDGLTRELSFDTGMELGDKGFVHLALYGRRSDNTNRQGYDKRQQYFARDALGRPVVLPTVSASDQTPVLPPGFTFDTREFTGVDRTSNYVNGNAERHEGLLNLNSELPLSDDSALYGFASYAYRKTHVPLVWRRPLESNNVRAIYPDGFEPLYTGVTTDVNTTVGAKGALSEWDWDLSQSWGFGRLKNSSENTLNASLGTASPTSFHLGNQTTEQATTNLDLRRDLDVGLRSPLRLAFGSEFRREEFKLTTGDPASYVNGGVRVLDGPSAGAAAPIGAQGFAGYQPLDAAKESRHSIAGYVDAENQVTEDFLLTAAGRYEKYNDFGSTTNGKISFFDQLTDHIALRGSISTGFRAPSLYDTYFSQTSSNVISGQFFILRRFAVDDPVAIALGATPLKPEKSRNYSLGSTFQLGSRLNLTADVYRIYVDDAIILSSFFLDAGTRNFLQSLGFIGIGGARFSTNAVDKRVDGVDLVGNYSVPIRSGDLSLSATFNLNKPQVTRVAPTPPQLAAVTSTPLFDAAAIRSVEEGTPRMRVSLVTKYATEQLSFSVRNIRYGAVTGFSGQRYGAKWITDLDGSYDITESVRLTLGAQNIFDVYPDEQLAQFNPGGLTPYPFSESPFGVSGAYYFLRARVQF